jgi:hypothetical protein
MTQLLYVGLVILVAWLATVNLWVLYLACMNLKRAKDADRIPRVGYWFGYPVLLVGLAADFFYNVILATVLFGELPQEWLLTGRLQRYLRDPDAGQAWWLYSRKTVARWLCDNLLDPFDPSGNHCA